MITEGALSGVVAGGKQFAAAGRPDSKSEAAGHVIQARLSPAEPGGEEEVGIGELLGGGKVQGAGEIGTIIQPYIRHQAAGAVGTPKWLVVEAVFGEEREETAPENNQA